MAAKTCYAIVKEDLLETSETKVCLVVESTGTLPLSFSNLEETKAWVRNSRARKHSDNVARTLYSIVEVGSTRFAEVYKATFGQAGEA
jgi:hypothetical protein